MTCVKFHYNASKDVEEVCIIIFSIMYNTVNKQGPVTLWCIKWITWNLCLAQLHIIMIICVNFHDNPSKNIEANCITKFSIHLKYFYIAKANNSVMHVVNHMNSVSCTTTHHSDDLCKVPVQSIMECRSFH